MSQQAARTGIHSCWDSLWKQSAAFLRLGRLGELSALIVTETDKLEAPLYLAKARGRSWGRTHAQRDPVPPSVITYCCAHHTAPYPMHPASPSGTATSQERLGWPLETQHGGDDLEPHSSPGACGVVQSRVTPFPHPMLKDIPENNCGLMSALPFDSSCMVFYQPEGIMNPLILCHWLVKGHYQSMTGKETGSGGGLSKGWGDARR